MAVQFLLAWSKSLWPLVPRSQRSLDGCQIFQGWTEIEVTGQIQEDLEDGIKL